MLVVIVPTAQEGLTIFPTHRIAATHEPLPPLEPSLERRRPCRSPRSTRAPASGYLRRRARASSTPSSSPATRREVGYTPYADEARAAVDAGEAEAAFLLRPPTVEQVAAVAKAGRDDAAEEHVLLSRSSPPACSSCRCD